MTIGNSVMSIGNGAFNYCTNLTSVIIPYSVTNFGYGAFGECTSLTNLYFLGNAPTLNISALSDVPATATVYYLEGSTGWGKTFDGHNTAVWTAGPPALSIHPSGKSVIITWSKGTLLESTNLSSGTWTTNDVTSPFTNTLEFNSQMKFYRVQDP